MNAINPNYAETIFRQLLRMIEEFNSDQRVLREGAVARMTGLSPSTIRNRCTMGHPSYDPDFPQPRSLGSGQNRTAVGWLQSEVVHWINTRPTANLTHQLNKRPKDSSRARARGIAEGDFSI